MGYEDLIAKLGRLLEASIAARYRGDMHATKVRLSARADGYMEALLDAGLVGRDELLEIVADVRRRDAESSDDVVADIAAAG
ncbi:MAG: hypothetical protein OXT09_33505 [Myxococcales bacterium]|nr:hypothetical protein [Myxococcales bacterium]